LGEIVGDEVVLLLLEERPRMSAMPNLLPLLRLVRRGLLAALGLGWLWPKAASCPVNIWRASMAASAESGLARIELWAAARPAADSGENGDDEEQEDEAGGALGLGEHGAAD